MAGELASQQYMDGRGGEKPRCSILHECKPSSRAAFEQIRGWRVLRVVGRGDAVRGEWGSWAS